MNKLKQSKRSVGPDDAQTSTIQINTTRKNKKKERKKERKKEIR